MTSPLVASSTAATTTKNGRKTTTATSDSATSTNRSARLSSAAAGRPTGARPPLGPDPARVGLSSAGGTGRSTPGGGGPRQLADRGTVGAPARDREEVGAGAGGHVGEVRARAVPADTGDPQPASLRVVVEERDRQVTGVGVGEHRPRQLLALDPCAV